MRKVVPFALAAITISAYLFFRYDTAEENIINSTPSDWMIRQRTYPQKEIRLDLFRNELSKIRLLKKNLKKENGEWEFAGPTNIGGRISDVEMSPNSLDTIYAGAASGGVIKSVDGGETWSTLFDNEISLSVGDIAVDPINTSIIYVGTGEVNAGGGSVTYGGNGIYKSTDGGQNWTNLGLEKTRYISRILVDPHNHNKIYVGAMGKLFGENEERGVYRSTDGGSTWEKVFYISGRTGCIDLAINPENTDIIYAAMWERIRTENSRYYGGSECAIYKSIDGGDNWVQLTNGIPNNDENIGRIGISLSASNPDILYAVFADYTGRFAGLYRSDNAGESWTRTNDQALSSASFFGGFGWWFGNIRVSPVNPDLVFVLGLDVYKSIDGGNNWNASSIGVHVDQHAMYIHPNHPEQIVLGNDGGIYISSNEGLSWIKKYNLPITQFYTCEVDYQNPEKIYGGTQDNFTIRTTTGNINDWHSITGGDGFYVLVDPKDPNYIYSESQYGNMYRSINGGLSFTVSRMGIDFNEPRNWKTPIVFNSQNTASLYYGSSRIYKSTDRAQTWNSISPPLADPNSGNLVFGTITTIAQAPSDSNYIYAGTDDGNVWVTKDGGIEWQQISESLPQRWITCVAVDPYNKELCYVTLSGYRQDDYISHIYKSENAGRSWTDISGNLPEVPLNDLIIDSSNTNTIYVASDVGVFYTVGNNDWKILGSNLPNVPVTDITLHNPTRKLIAATFGRSMYKYNLNSISNVIETKILENDFSVLQNYPNPFNPVTKIKFVIPEEAGDKRVRLSVYNILGSRISDLVNEIKSPGTYEIEFNGSDLASGVYIYKFTSGKFSVSKKMLLLK